MIKVALLYNGLPEGDIFKESWYNHKQNLIDNNENIEFDVFMHHWLNDKSLQSWYPLYKKEGSSNQIDEDFIVQIVKPKD